MGSQAIGNTSLTAARPPLPESGQDFVAEHGDTLGSVAKRLGVDEDELRKANPQALNPDGLYPGQRLAIPGSPQPGRDGASAPVDAAAPGRPAVGTTFKDGAASVTQKIPAADPVEGRSAEATLSGTADKNGVKGAAQFKAPTDFQAADGSKVGGESTTTFGAGFDNKGVGVDVTADRKTTSTQPDGSSAGSSSSTSGSVRFGEDGLGFGGSRKNGTETKGPEGNPRGRERKHREQGQPHALDEFGRRFGRARTRHRHDQCAGHDGDDEAFAERERDARHRRLQDREGRRHRRRRQDARQGAQRRRRARRQRQAGRRHQQQGRNDDLVPRRGSERDLEGQRVDRRQGGQGGRQDFRCAGTSKAAFPPASGFRRKPGFPTRRPRAGTPRR